MSEILLAAIPKASPAVQQIPHLHYLQFLLLAFVLTDSSLRLLKY